MKAKELLKKNNIDTYHFCKEMEIPISKIVKKKQTESELKEIENLVITYKNKFKSAKRRDSELFELADSQGLKVKDEKIEIPVNSHRDFSIELSEEEFLKTKLIFKE